MVVDNPTVLQVVLDNMVLVVYEYIVIQTASLTDECFFKVLKMVITN